MSNTTQHGRRRIRKARRIDWGGAALLLYVIAFLVFLVMPIIAVVAVSFSSASFIVFPMPGLSLRWYGRIIAYRPFIDSLIVSIEIAVCSATLGAFLGVPAVLWVARSPSRIASVVANLLLAPIAVPAIVLGFALLYLLSDLMLGISFLSLLIAHTVIAIPYVARTTFAVYRAQSPDLEEAAAVLGASRWQTLRHVTVPLIRPGIFAGGLFAVLISLDNLPLSFFFGNSDVNTLPVVMLSYMQNQFDPSIAAISTVQMLIALVTLAVVQALYGVDRLITT
ncbi:MAG TPA: ABC transporter permease [Rhodopila sp.]|uniref:ABC transporter permease n=1 Tax=Rhodopila sp. TaxID=2480087 RepID=UPI002C520C45|nr:ABC transporter permease [Rhodopila sp.]HVY16737.1 ABC transporter permease [Rhodopila sp.]